MDSSFNPYQHWLGLSPDTVAPDYYELLNLSAAERDSERIRDAARQALTRVRAIQPGPRAEQWTQLLDELVQAERTLADPVLRQVYDQGRLSGGHTADIPWARPATAQQPPISPPPYGHVPNSMNAGAEPPHSLSEAGALAAACESPAPPLTPSPPVPPDPVSPNITPPPVDNLSPPPPPPGGIPDPMLPLEPMGNYAPARVQPGADNPPPMLKTGIPIATPVPSNGPPQDPAETAPLPARSVIGVSHRNQASHRGVSAARAPLVIAAGCALVLLLVVIAYFGTRGSAQSSSAQSSSTQSSSAEAESHNGPATTGRQDKDRKTARAKSPERPSRREADSAKAQRTGARDAQQTELPVEHQSADTASPPAAESARPTPKAVSEPSGVGRQSPLPAPPQPDPVSSRSTDPVPPMSVPTKDELSKLTRAMKTARSALAEQNIDIARQELKKARMVARLDRHVNMVERLELLARYASDYQSALKEAIDSFDSGDVINLPGGARVAIVETAPTTITVRAVGRNKRYTRNDLPIVLSLGISESWLDDSKPGSLIIRGVYLSLHKLADAEQREKGREFLLGAAQQGVDVGDLLQALRDDYDQI